MPISSLRHRAIAAAALTALTLSACGGDPAEEEGEPEGSAAVTAAVLPPISQPGPRAADPADARGVISARFDAESAGREAALERSAAGGSGEWEEVATGEVNANGSVAFTLEEAADDASYRVVAAADGDLPAVTSAEVDGAAPEADYVEQFDGDELSEAWVHRGEDYNPDGLRRCSKGSPDAVRVGGGVANLLVIDDPERDEPCTAVSADGEDLGQFDYRLNGHISSQALFTYGVTAARIKFQREKGQHGSFWLQGNLGIEPTDPKKNGAEIDVVEYFGESRDDRLASFVYYPTEDGPVKEGDWIENASQFLASQDDDWWKAFHVFSVEWTPEEYVIRIDGQEAWRTTEGISGQPEFVVLSLLSSDYELPNLPDGALPQAMAVDWVQHWAPPEG